MIATPFLQAASNAFQVTLLAKPHGNELAKRFFPSVEVIPFTAPWTAFRHKYGLLKWPWRQLFRLRRLCAARGFEIGVSARWDPREHLLLRFLGLQRRVGFPRLGSQMLLTDLLTRPGPASHRYEHWRTAAAALGLGLPTREAFRPAVKGPGQEVLVHTGAGQKVRVWPLERYRSLVARLERKNYKVRVVCDLEQQAWWRSAGRADAAAPRSLDELASLLESAGAFIGNDSGPGHLAALSGVPTFTLFGPQLPEWFVPLHPAAEWVSGKPCPYKPCWDTCRFPTPNCLWDLDEDSVWTQVERFVAKHVYKP